jgi:hypothetical protein
VTGDGDDYDSNADADADAEREREHEREAAAEEEEEKQELMGAIMADLRRRIAVADEEAWMFGEDDTLLGDEGGTGGFD